MTLKSSEVEQELRDEISQLKDSMYQLEQGKKQALLQLVDLHNQKDLLEKELASNSSKSVASTPADQETIITQKHTIETLEKELRLFRDAQRELSSADKKLNSSNAQHNGRFYSSGTDPKELRRAWLAV